MTATVPARIVPATVARAAGTLEDRAYASFERGDLQQASQEFDALLAAGESADLHYMLGLTAKYLGDWGRALHHNLRAQALRDTFDEAATWNAAIAATALGDWPEARRQWTRCGIELPDGEGATWGDFGLCSLRLNPWGDSETVFARRIDPVRAQLVNVPLPESGYCYGDIVLHDGAATGQRAAGASQVPIFNVLARLVPSAFRTYTAFVRCDAPQDAGVLSGGCGPGIGTIEDWTQSITHFCPRCSAGDAHDEDDACQAAEAAPWDTMRTFGVAAQSRRSVDKLLRDWKAEGSGRRVESIEWCPYPTTAPPPGIVWWRLPD